MLFGSFFHHSYDFQYNENFIIANVLLKIVKMSEMISLHKLENFGISPDYGT